MTSGESVLPGAPVSTGTYVIWKLHEITRIIYPQNRSMSFL